jgi:tetratricopeptide (TPR) repeat protein
VRGRAAFKRVIALPSIEPSARAQLLRRGASFAIGQADYPEARALNQECRRLCEQLNDTNGVAETLFTDGAIEQQMGHQDLAYSHYTEALDGLRAAGNAYTESLALHNIVLISIAKGDLDEAEARILEAASPLARASNGVLTAHFTALRGRIALKRGSLSEAETYLREALEVMLRVGSRLDIGTLYSEVSGVLLQLKRFSEAADAAASCVSIGLELDSPVLLIPRS